VKINELPGGVIYIEDAFPLAKDFVQAIEENNENKEINHIIPPWDKWMDGYHIDGVWTKVHERGLVKNVDWDYTINQKGDTWPKIKVDSNYSQEHYKAYSILEMIDKPYREALDIWSEKTGNLKVNLVSKNYTIKKYNTGGDIPIHTDRDHDKDWNTYDWTALVYLNDDYDGGELEFNNLGYKIKPSAGSIIFFSTDEAHTAHAVVSGNKYFIFFYIHSDVGYTHAIGEKFKTTEDKLREKANE
jgi:predicted 2-oxoglutarate/Fe(II)-dependent dioxygenase YbiX